MRRTLFGLAVSAIIPAAAIALGVFRLDPSWRSPQLAAVAASLWLLFALAFAIPFATIAAIAILRGTGMSRSLLWAAVVAIPFAFLWYERLKPLELWTPRYRPDVFGIVGLAAAALLTIAILRVTTAEWTKPFHPAAVALAAALVAALALRAYVGLFEPSPERSTAARRIAGVPARSSDTMFASGAGGRVLFIGIDGLDWNVLERLLAQDRLRHIHALLRSGRSFDLDAAGLQMSPEIWTAIYTGRRPLFSGYVGWDFPGVSRRLDLMPPFGGRPMWGANKWLWRTVSIGAWQPVSISTESMIGPAFWRVAAAAGRDVAVFNPVPYEVRGEEVNGVFAWEHDETYEAHWRNAGKAWNERTSFVGGFRQTAAESIDLERRRAAAAGALLARAHPALCVYYTQTVDEISHWNWPSTGDLERSVVASAYEEVDRSVGELVDRFGPADAVVLVSDHGWEFNPYQHERMPHGVLVVADGRSSGFGGTAMVGAVAPTVLALLKLPRDAAGLAPIAGAPDFGVADYSGVRPLFLSAGAARPDDGARQRLQSLGYIGW